MVITRTRTHNDINIKINSHQVTPKKCIKYLGVNIDCGWRFTDHAKILAAKASKVVQRLSRIMPNIGGAKPTKRKLLSNMAHSILLYGAPVWAEDMSATGWEELLKVQRRICLRVPSAYCTTSRDEIGVITGIPPLDLFANDRKLKHDTKRNPELTPPTETILDVWQKRWDNCKTGRWTHVLILNIGQWISRRHGETNYHLTQVLSGHGCFAADLKRFGKLQCSECWFCENPMDDAEHTVFTCDAWYSRRRQVELTLGTDLNPSNLITTMMATKENWNALSEMIKEIMVKKETEERRRQAQQ